MKNSYAGKIRCFVHKTDDNEYEEFAITVFDDRLISDVDDDMRECEILTMETDNIGLYGFEDSIKDILKNYPIDDCVEIVADAHVEYTSDEDVNAEMWLENAKHRKLSKYQISRFISKQFLKYTGPHGWGLKEND